MDFRIRFKSKPDHAAHLASVHASICYRCPHCQKEFSTRKGVTNHLITHLGTPLSKPFRCSLCDYTAAKKYHINVHLTNSHGKRQGTAGHVIVDEQMLEERAKIIWAQSDKIEADVKTGSKEGID